MSLFSDGDTSYLLRDQYRTSQNLISRINLHDLYSVNTYGWHRWVLDQLELSGAVTLLEVGCGNGALWTKNADRLSPKWTIVASDFSPGIVDGTRAALSDLGATFEFAVYDAQSLPRPGASFDVVVANHVLYHVPQRDEALREGWRVLVPGGRLCATTNGLAHLRELDDLMEAVFPELDRDDTARKFGLESGVEQVARVFADVEVRRYDDHLEITDARAVVDYVLSTPAAAIADDRRLADIRRRVEEVIEDQGMFRVTKDAGMIVADKR